MPTCLYKPCPQIITGTHSCKIYEMGCILWGSLKKGGKRERNNTSLETGFLQMLNSGILSELKRIFLHRAKLMTWSSMLLEQWLVWCSRQCWPGVSRNYGLCLFVKYTKTHVVMICEVKNYLLRESKTLIIIIVHQVWAPKFINVLKIGIILTSSPRISLGKILHLNRFTFACV